MVKQTVVSKQLRDLGLKFRILGRAEIRELATVLNHREIIRHCAFGYYQGGSALLVATDSRLLLIDKRPFFLNLEDIRYEMISEVDYAGRLLDARVEIFTANKMLSFRSLSNDRLRKMCEFIQNQITKARRTEHLLGGRSLAESWKRRPHLPLLPRPKFSKYTSTNEVNSTNFTLY